MNIIEILKKNKLTISAAESLTAGLVCAGICDYAGASSVFKGGIVSYTKEMKCRLLGLAMEDIEKYGVYSRQTVISMAEGIQRKTGSDIAIATSGVAGPESDENVAAGTVYFCFLIRQTPITECVVFSGDRNEVRRQAASYAVSRICQLLDFKS